MNSLCLSQLMKRLLPPNMHSAAKQYHKKIASGRRAMAATFRHYYFMLPQSLFKKGLYPEVLAIFLTTRCNLRCFICRREGFKGKDVNFANLKKLEQAIKYARTIDLTGWGEPFLYPKFEEVLAYIYSLNPRNDLIQITTNGTRLGEHVARLLSGHLKLLVISLNAATAETYNRDMQNGNFGRTLSSIQAFLSGLEEKDRGKITFHFVAHTRNFHEIPEFVGLAHRLGISNVSIGHYLVSSMQHSQYSLLNVKKEYNMLVDRARDLGNEWGISVSARQFFRESQRFAQECMSPFKECFIEINGDVGPCCFAGNYRMGNAYETTFEEVWFGKAYRKLRKKRHLRACQTCTPIITFDDPRAHFAAHFKEKKDFLAIEQKYRTNWRPRSQAAQETRDN